MSTQGLEVIDHTVQLTHEWINEVRDRLGLSSSSDALRFLRVILTELRDHLGPNEVAQLSAQMPLLIRGMFFEGWRPASTPIRDRKGEHFFARIESQVGTTMEWRGHADIAAVLQTLDHRISAGEIADVKAALPQAIRAIWPD